MNIVIVTREPIIPETHIPLSQNRDVWFRSHPSKLKSLPIDILILGSDLTEEQETLALEKTRPIIEPKVFRLIECDREGVPLDPRIRRWTNDAE